MASPSKDKKDSNPIAKACSNCFAAKGKDSATKLSACARCGLVVYCSRDCQRAHWKASHKQHCIAKADRSPQLQNSLDAPNDEATSTAVSKESCVICLNVLSDASRCILPCTHVFHSTCVAELRKFGVNEACPLCRTPLPPGPEKLYEEGVRRFVMIEYLVARGYASWSTLSASAQHEVDAVVAGWQAAAEQGYLPAQDSLGNLYAQGHGVAQSDAKALRWFKMAAEQGHARAQFNVGSLFHHGRGVVQSYTEAMKWYLKASDQGNVEAQCNIRALYQYGQGVPKSGSEAAKWYRKSAEKGHANGQYNLALMYDQGREVPENLGEAAKWYRKAANLGIVLAQLSLGDCYDKGRGLAQNYVEAATWYRKAADQGNDTAQFRMGYLHAMGLTMASR